MKVTMFKAKDGQLFESKKQADKRNEELRLKPALDKFVASLTAIVSDADGNDVFYREELAMTLLVHADTLRGILNEALIVRRPRKPKLVPVPAVEPAKSPVAAVA